MKVKYILSCVKNNNAGTCTAQQPKLKKPRWNCKKAKGNKNLERVLKCTEIKLKLCTWNVSVTVRVALHEEVRNHHDFNYEEVGVREHCHISVVTCYFTVC